MTVCDLSSDGGQRFGDGVRRRVRVNPFIPYENITQIHPHGVTKALGYWGRNPAGVVTRLANDKGGPRDILNPFALEKEIPLKESLEAHAIRLAKKKGVKGKAILCGVGAAHIPRSDGVPVSVATVSPKDSELLGKLEEAGDAAYQVGSSEQSRCHSI
ncbi:hypothetical protein Tco_0643746 [Tanacetum coccineum]